jgi:hypothetical protein
MRRLLILAALLCGCPQPLPPTPTPLPATYESACANLAAMGCADGKATTCAATLQRMVEGRITRVDVACLATARDFPSARACGGVKCP